jgi:hypothetical protein
MSQTVQLLFLLQESFRDARWTHIYLRTFLLNLNYSQPSRLIKLLDSQTIVQEKYQRSQLYQQVTHLALLADKFLQHHQLVSLTILYHHRWHIVSHARNDIVLASIVHGRFNDHVVIHKKNWTLRTNDKYSIISMNLNGSHIVSTIYIKRSIE